VERRQHATGRDAQPSGRSALDEMVTQQAVIISGIDDFKLLLRRPAAGGTAPGHSIAGEQPAPRPGRGPSGFLSRRR
jgi:hypothetical protein